MRVEVSAPALASDAQVHGGVVRAEVVEDVVGGVDDAVGVHGRVEVGGDHRDLAAHLPRVEVHDRLHAVEVAEAVPGLRARDRGRVEEIRFMRNAVWESIMKRIPLNLRGLLVLAS